MMSGGRKLTALVMGIATHAGTAVAHTSGPDHYHAPGPLELAGADMAVVAGVLAVNILTWILVLYAVRRYLG